MKIKHEEVIIPEENPFENCKLGREQYASVLTDIMTTYADGFVFALNNEWGTGKTTFVKMWQQQLQNEGFKTIYFNAWENDFDCNPLVAIMSELKTLSDNNNKAIFKTVVEKGAVLVKNVAPALLKAVAKRYIDIDTVNDAIENTAKGATEILEEEIKEYSKKKETILDFRKELEKFIKRSGTEKPLIFIIDELDRCRPTYAVEVLEQMKHFFSVSGIAFVLSIDKNHLASAVRGFYGSENINTDEYLRRFIDLEYSLPLPSQRDYTKYLFDYYSFNDFYSSEKRRQCNDFQNEAEMLLKMADFLFEKSKATLRQQEKILGMTRLILSSFQSNQHTFSHLLFVLVYFKNFHTDLYSQIMQNKLSLQELSDEYTSVIGEIPNNGYGINLNYVEGLLLYFYNNSQDYPIKKELLEMDKDNNPITFIKSKNDKQGDYLARCFQNIHQQMNYDDFRLKFLLDKINLTAPILIQNQ